VELSAARPFHVQQRSRRHRGRYAPRHQSRSNRATIRRPPRRHRYPHLETPMTITATPVPTAPTTTNSTTTTPATGGTSDTSGTSGVVDNQMIASNFTTFLQLLTTQLKNQNPLDPLDTNQFTQQLVQFAQVEQQMKSNDQLSSLVSLEQSA